jgi:acetyltransferase-like isoleucine patch superfamily enzyme
MIREATGRSLFRRARPLIRALQAALGALPVTVRMALWGMSSAGSSKFRLGIRYVLASTLAKTCSENVFLGPRITVVGWGGLEIGRNVSIHQDSYIDASGGVLIGSDVSIAHAVSILSFEHSYDDLRTPIKYNPLRYGPVHISDDVWIGCGVRILSGVTIGSRAIVAAGAVVANDVPSGTVVGGVPARILKRIPVP